MKFAAGLNRIISPPDQTRAEIGTEIDAGVCANAVNKVTNQIFNRLKTRRALPSKMAALAAASSAIFASI